ncbi:unnamed protein product, partial [Sphacelaria rigidula]
AVYASLGDTITYIFTIHNTGTTTLSELELKDSMVSCPFYSIIDTWHISSLAPGAAVGCEGDMGYAVTQDDIDAGLVASNATITAVSPFPNSVPIESEAKDTTDVPRDSSILVEKTMKIMTTVSGLDTELSDADDWAIFDIVVTNTGNTALSKVVLTDDMFSEGSTACNNNFSAATSNFLPSVNPDGAAIGCEVTLNLTSAHVDAGEISGTAKVSSQAAHCLSKRSP